MPIRRGQLIGRDDTPRSQSFRKKVETLIRAVSPPKANASAAPARLRSAALGAEAGRTWWKEREKASDRCDGAKASGVAASPVGERRSLRAIAGQ